MSGIYEVNALDTFVLSIVVLFVGMTLPRKIAFLDEYNIPPAVSGGLICSVILAVVSRIFDVDISFNMEIRNFLLLVFFRCIGLGVQGCA